MACTSKPQSPSIHISLVNNDHSVKIKGLEYAVIREINRDSVTDGWQNLLPVYRMPADTDMKDYQPVQHGQYRLKDSAVVFTPDTPFIKGTTYFVRYYQFGVNADGWDLIKSKKKPGSTHFIDLVFK